MDIVMRTAPSHPVCRSHWPATLLLLFFANAEPLQAQVAITHCGQVVTTDAVMTGDLVCDALAPGEIAIYIHASDVTLDMGGYTLWGIPERIGIRAEHSDAVSVLSNTIVKNGTLENWDNARDLVRTQGAIVEYITIRNLVADDSDLFSMGIRIAHSQATLVKDSYFEMLPVPHKEMIIMASSEATITDNEFKNGSVGVNVSGYCSAGEPGSNAAVVNNRFTGMNITGVLVHCAENTLIANNETVGTDGLGLDGTSPDAISGVTIEGNTMRGGYIGIHFEGTTGVSVLNNVIRDYWRGVFLDASWCVVAPSPECVYATGNVISGNVATGSYIDLSHREEAVGNTWENNKCQTKEGAEIPECAILFLDGFEY